MVKKTGAKAAVALSSGTAAIHMALKSIGIKQNDIVFCQSLTFSASANPIVYEKAIPVFIDSDESWNMSPDALEKAFEKYKDNFDYYGVADQQFRFSLIINSDTLDQSFRLG